MQKHHLKVTSAAFSYVNSRAKSCIIRDNDRKFKTGDTVILHEFNLSQMNFTGNTVSRQIVLANFAEKPRKKSSRVILFLKCN